MAVTGESSQPSPDRSELDGARTRPAVSVVVPFAGSVAAAQATLGRLAVLELRPGDEIVIADNSDDGSMRAALRAAGAPAAARWVAAHGLRSAYFARNVGAEAAGNQWLLFLDGDVRPVPGLLNAFLSPVADSRDGALAGSVKGDPDQASLAARYARSRGYLDQERSLNNSYRPAAVTANLLVRTEAWMAAGRFVEDVQSGEDYDFCWRMQDAGWTLGYRPDALVYHLHRETVAALLRQVRRDAAGRSWLRRRRPGSFAKAHAIRDALRAGGAALRWGVTGDRERAAFRALDAAVSLTDALGEHTSNLAVRSEQSRRLRPRRQNPPSDPA